MMTKLKVCNLNTLTSPKDIYDYLPDTVVYARMVLDITSKYYAPSQFINQNDTNLVKHVTKVNINTKPYNTIYEVMTKCHSNRYFSASNYMTCTNTDLYHLFFRVKNDQYIMESIRIYEFLKCKSKILDQLNDPYNSTSQSLLYNSITDGVIKRTSSVIAAIDACKQVCDKKGIINPDKMVVIFHEYGFDIGSRVNDLPIETYTFIKEQINAHVKQSLIEFEKERDIDLSQVYRYIFHGN